MPNPRTTAGLAIAAAVCGLLLWTLGQRRPETSGLLPGRAQGLLFPRGLGDVDSVIVEQGGFRMDLRRQGGHWHQVEPFVAEVDQVAVRRILDVLADAPLLERITLDELRRRDLKLQDFGLAPAQTRVVIRNAAQRIELCFGRRTPDNSEVYFYRDVAAQVLVTPGAVLDAVPVSLESVRERALLSDSGQPTTALELRRSEMPYVKLVRDGGGWRMTQPVAAAADADAVDNVLAALRHTRIETFIWPSGTTNVADQASGSLRSRLAIYGLDADSAVQVQLWETGGANGVRLRFGSAVVGHSGWVYALTADEQSVVAVTNAVLPPLLVPPVALRERRLFMTTPDDVTRLQLRFADQLVECRRGRDGTWALVSPLEDAVDQDRVARLLAGLLRLRADRILDAPAGMTSEAFLPTNPVCVVEMATTTRVDRLVVAPGAMAGWMDLMFTNRLTCYSVATSNLPPAVLAPAAAYGLCDRMVLACATSLVRRVTVRRGAASESVERTPDNETVWQVSGSPTGKTIVPEALGAWLVLLGGLPAARIERLGAAAHDGDVFGMNAPWMEIAVDLLSADALRKVVLVGNAAPDGGRYAMLRGHDVIFVLGPETVRVLGLKLVQAVPEPVAPPARRP